MSYMIFFIGLIFGFLALSSCSSRKGGVRLSKEAANYIELEGSEVPGGIGDYTDADGNYYARIGSPFENIKVIKIEEIGTDAKHQSQKADGGQ